MEETDFYMVSADTEPLMGPRACRIEERLLAERDDWLLLVRVEPPLPTGRTSEAEWLLASRWKGETLVPMSSWPIGVLVCPLPSPEVKGSGRVSRKDLTIDYWAELYPSRQEAEESLEPYHGQPRF